jgi:hypothetical protein
MKLPSTFVVEWTETVDKDEFVFAYTKTEAESIVMDKLRGSEYTITGVREIEGKYIEALEA